MHARARTRALTALAAGLVVAGTAPALADTVTLSQESVTLTAGTSGSIRVYLLAQDASDPVAGCSAGANNDKVTISFTSSTSAVAEAPAPVHITECDNPSTTDVIEGAKSVPLFALAAGTTTITASGSGGVQIVTGSGRDRVVTSSTHTSDALTLTVNPAVQQPPPNTAPIVSVTGVTNGATYEAGAVPAAGCSVTDEDASASATPVVDSTGLDGQGVGSQTVNCSYTDSGDLRGSASATYSIVDTTAPTLSGVPGNITEEATSAAGAVVSWAAPAASGRTGETRSVSCSPASGTTFGLGTTTVSCTASDGTGNRSGAQTFDVTVRDTMAPTLSNMPANQELTATTRNGAVATWTAPTASDSVDPDATTSCTPASGTTFPLGTSTVSCTASDASGNKSAAQSFTVKVTYSASGALQPINGDGSSSFKLGSTVPVKFKLTDASAGITDAVATIKTAKVANGLAGAETEAVTSTAASTGSAFRYDAVSGQYVYNWGTKGLSEGTYQIRIDLGDGRTDRIVNVTLRK